MARHALVDKSGKVINVIIWEGAAWKPPKDHYVIQSDTADIGDIYDFNAQKFTKLIVAE